MCSVNTKMSNASMTQLSLINPAEFDIPQQFDYSSPILSFSPLPLRNNYNNANIPKYPPGLTRQTTGPIPKYPPGLPRQTSTPIPKYPPGLPMPPTNTKIPKYPPGLLRKQNNAMNTYNNPMDIDLKIHKYITIRFTLNMLNDLFKINEQINHKGRANYIISSMFNDTDV